MDSWIHLEICVHRSKTCEVVFAIDVKDTSQSNDGRAVAIKIMKDRSQFECEIRARQKYELDSCVVKLLGWMFKGLSLGKDAKI